MDELRKLYEFIKDFWKLIKSSYELPEGDDTQYWADLTRYAVILGHKYEEHDLVKNLLLTYLEYQERRRMDAKNQS